LSFDFHQSNARDGRGRWPVVLCWLVILAMGGGAHAQQAASPSNQDGASPTIEGAKTNVAVADKPPFWVAGVVITPAQRSAFLVVRDDTRRDTGVVTLREGQSYEGYRVRAIDADRVHFDRNGVETSVVVGRPADAPGSVPDAVRRPFVILGPDKPIPNIPATGRSLKRGEGSRAAPLPQGSASESPAPDPEVLGKIFDALSNSPQFQQRMEEQRSVIQRKLESTEPMPSPQRGPQPDRLPDVPASNAPPTAPR